jgi:hypothetical protein
MTSIRIAISDDHPTIRFAAVELYLRHHAEIATALANALRERALGHHAAAQVEWSALKQRIWQKEDDLHPVLDVYLFTRVYDGIFKTNH